MNFEAQMFELYVLAMMRIIRRAGRAPDTVAYTIHELWSEMCSVHPGGFDQCPEDFDHLMTRGSDYLRKVFRFAKERLEYVGKEP